MKLWPWFTPKPSPAEIANARLTAHRDANAASLEVRNYRINRAAGKLGWSRKQGRAAQ